MNKETLEERFLKIEDGFIKTASVYLVGELVIGGKSKIRVVVKNKLTGRERVTNAERWIHPHARADRSIPQTNFWFEYGNKTHDVEIL